MAADFGSGEWDQRKALLLGVLGVGVLLLCVVGCMLAALCCGKAGAGVAPLGARWGKGGEYTRVAREAEDEEGGEEHAGGQLVKWSGHEI